MKKILQCINYLLAKSLTPKSNLFNINYNEKLVNDSVEILTYLRITFPTFHHP